MRPYTTKGEPLCLTRSLRNVLSRQGLLWPWSLPRQPHCLQHAAVVRPQRAPIRVARPRHLARLKSHPFMRCCRPQSSPAVYFVWHLHSATHPTSITKRTTPRQPVSQSTLETQSLECSASRPTSPTS